MLLKIQGFRDVTPGRRLDSDVPNDCGVFISKSEQTKKDLPCCFIGVDSQDRLMGGVWIGEGMERNRGAKFKVLSGPLILSRKT